MQQILLFVWPYVELSLSGWCWQRDEADMVDFVRNTPAEFREYYIQMQAAKRSQAPQPSQVCFSGAWVFCLPPQVILYLNVSKLGQTTSDELVLLRCNLDRSMRTVLSRLDSWTLALLVYMCAQPAQNINSEVIFILEDAFPAQHGPHLWVPKAYIHMRLHTLHPYPRDFHGIICNAWPCRKDNNLICSGYGSGA